MSMSPECLENDCSTSWHCFHQPFPPFQPLVSTCKPLLQVPVRWACLHQCAHRSSKSMIFQRHAKLESQQRLEMHAYCMGTFFACSESNTMFLSSPEDLLQGLNVRLGQLLQYHPWLHSQWIAQCSRFTLRIQIFFISWLSYTSARGAWPIARHHIVEGINFPSRYSPPFSPNLRQICDSD